MSRRMLLEDDCLTQNNSNDLFAIVEKLPGRHPGYYSFDGNAMNMFVSTGSGHQRYFITKDKPSALPSNWHDSSTHTNSQGIFDIKQGDVIKFEYVQLDGGSALSEFKSVVQCVGFNTNKSKAYSDIFNDLGYIEYVISEDDRFNTVFIGLIVGKDKLLSNFTFNIYLNGVIITKFQ